MSLKILGKFKDPNRKILKKVSPEGPLIAEMQDVLEQMAMVRHITASFETGEAGTLKVYFPYKVRITKIRFQVTKTLAGTDAGTIDVQTSGAVEIGSQVSIAAATAVGNEPTAIVPAGTGQVVAAGDFVQIVSAKTTAGGRCSVHLEYVLNL